MANSVSLLQEALTRATISSVPNTPRKLFPNSEQGSGSEDEDQIVGVKTPATPRAQSRASSRSTSPTRANKRRELKEKEKGLDPLRRLPGELSQKIFGSLDIHSLLNCGRVSKRWRKSQTINWCWYVHYQRKSFTYFDDDWYGEKLPSWTKKESKTAWAQRFASTYRRDDLATEADLERARSDGWRTPKEEREERWRIENGDADSENVEPGSDKLAMRAYYKSLKNSKAKGKGGRSVSERGRDRTGWDGGTNDWN